MLDKNELLKSKVVVSTEGVEPECLHHDAIMDLRRRVVSKGVVSREELGAALKTIALDVGYIQNAKKEKEKKEKEKKGKGSKKKVLKAEELQQHSQDLLDLI